MSYRYCVPQEVRLFLKVSGSNGEAYDQSIGVREQEGPTLCQCGGTKPLIMFNEMA